MYKVKPEDIQKSHYVKFNGEEQKFVLSVAREMKIRSITINDSNLKQALQLHDEAWARYGRDISHLAQGLLQHNKGSSQQRMIILIGLPGSGKSTFAHRLMGYGWARVNQDDLGSRKRCEELTIQLLREGRNVIIDRCNFEPLQRLTWIQLAAAHHLKWITAVLFNIPTHICKSRVFVRQNHPTIAPGERGWAIIDQFGQLLTEPAQIEGFSEILKISNEEEFAKIVEQMKMESPQPSLEQKIVEEVVMKEEDVKIPDEKQEATEITKQVTEDSAEVQVKKEAEERIASFSIIVEENNDKS